MIDLGVLKIVESPEEDDFELPAYGTPGWVLVEILGSGDSPVYRYDIEERAVDGDASTFWIEEGVGIDFWIDSYAPDNLEPGWYVFENVIGHYIKGDGWMVDDDEEWNYERVRPATQKEIDELYVETT